MNRLRSTLRQFGIKSGDIALLLALLALSLISGIIIAVTMPSPEYVVIKSDGVETARLPLNEDCTYRIGDGNTIEISGGSVRMSFADCPDKICVKTGAISRSGQSIVCAPHRIVVTITGKQSNNSYDVITN